MPERRIRVLIVDDSSLVRKVLSDLLSADPAIEVVGTAADPYAARDKIESLQPDVLTLDIEMPRMDGLSFLKLLMRHRPMPVLVISSLTTTGSLKALEALQAGAVDVMPKPTGPLSGPTEAVALTAKVKAAFQARFKRVIEAARPTPASARAGTVAGHTARAGASAPRHYSSREVILMGASTGGTEALKKVLTELSECPPAICVVQHIPAYFSRAFADRLNTLCRFAVREAQHGDKVQPGLALIAPGGYHMVLRWIGHGYVVDLNEGPMLHHQRPAVDMLFDSAVRAGAGPHTLALLLTGMGADGAAGLLRLKEAGATTVAQDEASCVVFGMPREAIRLGAAQKVLSLDHMSSFIERHSQEAAVQKMGP